MKYVIWLLIVTFIPSYFTKRKGKVSVLGITIAIILGTIALNIF